MAVRFGELTDEGLLASYEIIRRQAAADMQLRGEYRLVSEAPRRYVAELQKEMELRALHFAAIEWS